MKSPVIDSYAIRLGRIEANHISATQKLRDANELADSIANAITAMHAAYRLLDSVAFVAREGDSAPITAALSAACARLGRPITSGN